MDPHETQSYDVLTVAEKRSSETGFLENPQSKSLSDEAKLSGPLDKLQKVWAGSGLVVALLRLLLNPEKTEMVFKIVDSSRRSGYRGFDPMLSRCYSDPQLQKLWAERVAFGKIEVLELAKYPRNTFGFAFAQHILGNDLDVNFFPKLVVRDELDFLFLRLRQMHDLWHVIAGYRTSVEDELALQGFAHGQTQNPLSLLLVSGGLLHLLWKTPASAPRAFRRIVEGYQRGAQCHPLLGVRLEESFAEDLNELRGRLNVPALGCEVPLSGGMIGFVEDDSGAVAEVQIEAPRV